MYLFVLALLCCTICLQAEEKKQFTTKEKIEQFSQYVGFTLAKELQQMKFEYDAEAILQGIRSYQAGEEYKSRFEGEDKVGLILQIQEELFEKKAAENKNFVEVFFRDKAREPTVTKLIDNQLYYEVLTQGNGHATVCETASPLMHYSVCTHEGIKIADTFETGKPVQISLTNTIPGFVKGVIGMKVGERRKLYVHPDLAYRRVGLVPPNSLLIFYIEVIEIR